jgi:uncharacterized protein YdaU (DUF1376 family)
MSDLPVLPIAVADLITDTTHMSAEQFGAYVRVLLAMWRNGAELDDDDAGLAQLTGVPLKRWRAMREIVLRPVSIIDGKLFQKRLSKTWDDVQRLRLQRVSAANTRWNRDCGNDASGYANSLRNGYARTTSAYANGMREPCERNAILKEKKITSSFPDAARASENPTVSTAASSATAAKPPAASALPAPASGSAMSTVEASKITPSDGLAEVLKKRGWT